ncbi:MAG: hypothetical protein O7C98_14825, partial [Planctomycetota bacterium]|nr:hypothetical protein [Planctomycetota bacterium]
PKKVEVWFELTNRAGNVGVYAHDTVDLRPDPASPGNPVKIGIFSAQAAWPPSGGTPVTWKSPIVMVQGSPQLPTPRPLDLSAWYVCKRIFCPRGTGPCKNVAQNAPVPPAQPPFPRAYDIEIVCSCN